jgi:hypothetical protein
MFVLHWIFRNGHRWEKDFVSSDEMMQFINTCALVAHPDVDTVFCSDGVVKSYFKGQV